MDLITLSPKPPKSAAFYPISGPSKMLQQNQTKRGAARRDLFAYIEGYYNRQRLLSALGYITPDQAKR